MIDAFDLTPVTPIDASAGQVRVEIVGGTPDMDRELAEAVERRWAELLAENPRHHNGAILAIDGFDPATNTIRARRDEYKRLAVQPSVNTRVRIMSVTGVVVAADAQGRNCALLAQRSHQTRIYGGLWELAPSGGIDPPGDDRDSLTLGDAHAQLADELREELGLALDIAAARPVALSVDAPGNSVDIVLRLDTGASIESLGLDEARSNWEYTGVRWVALEDARAYAAEHEGELIPPTRDVLRWLGA